MKENLIFRLKAQYKAENPETGDLEKAKLEILAQCTDYTEAEKLMAKIIEQYNLNKFDPCVYEIIKMKFEAGDIYGCAPLVSEDAGKLTCGLLQHFFNNETDGLYAVKTIVFGDKEEKEKDLKRTFYIPAQNVAAAMSVATSILLHEKRNLNDCLIPSATLDNAVYVYLRPKTSESIYKYMTEVNFK